MDSPQRAVERDQDRWRDAFQPPSLNLPKGGGAIRSIGEKFDSAPVTGTASLSVPIAASPGRNGFGPALALTYDSGSGNGPFGFGWRLDLAAITRKTAKGLPTYADRQESDVFLLSGAEDLVPLLVETETGWRREIPQRDLIGAHEYEIFAYRPRVEGLFARIERWARIDGQDTFWKTISRDNVSTFYGRTPDSRIVDPADPARVFGWMICETSDDKGNVALYEYKREDRAGVDTGQAHERNRAEEPPTANVYLKRIKYGNTPSYLRETDASRLTWLFELVFDYGEGHYAEQSPDAEGRVFAAASPLERADTNWTVRADPFSNYRAGFEVRTYRICHRVLMFHRFAELGPEPVLVRSTDFAYTGARSFTFLESVSHSGYVAFPDHDLLKQSMPPLAFTYSTSPSATDIAERPIESVAADSVVNVPVGIDESRYRWADLDGEGIAGVLVEQGDAWYYKRNLGRGRFAQIEQVAARPALAARGSYRLMDLAGDGHLEVAVADRDIAGVVERTVNGGWTAFKPFASAPNVAWTDPQVRFLDVTGDGLADLVLSEQDAFVWYPSLGNDGFAPAEQTVKVLDEEKGPRVVFADGTDTIFLADMSGDGLTDLVRIRNGEVCYWPNVGYGRFAAKVTMDRSPWFDAPERFDPARIRLADIDGSGLTDIIYLDAERTVVFFNQSGNGWSDARLLPQCPHIDDLSATQVIDLLGAGTACLVWSSPLPDHAARPLRYIDLMGGTKPHLLVGISNNIGGTTRLEYASSTKFYLDDRAIGRPWVTRLPFPVHVLTRVTRADAWRGTAFSTTYSYHHGYFDGVEREFRGFGRVEQIDVEDYGTFAAANVASPYVTQDKRLYQPPIRTVTWFHTGVPDRHVLEGMEREYFPSRIAGTTAFPEKPLPDVDLTGLAPDEMHEALRACKGVVLRREIFELDVDTLSMRRPAETRLDLAAAHSYQIRRVQPKADNRAAVFLVTDGESISYQYDLDLTATPLVPDPRVMHTLTLRSDDLGNPQQLVSVVYGRRGSFQDGSLTLQDVERIRAVQAEGHISYKETRYTHDTIVRRSAAADAPIRHHRLRRACEALAYELTGVPVPAAGYLELGDLRAFALSAFYPVPDGVQPVAVGALDYHQRPTGGIEKRLVEYVRSLFWKDDLSGGASLGELGALGLKYEDYKLALTSDLLTAVFGSLLDTPLGNPALPAATARERLDDPDVSGYIRPTNGSTWATLFGEAAPTEYWMRSGVVGFAPDAPDHFYLPERYIDAFGTPTSIEYDSTYDLFVESSADALGNTGSVARFDFRTLCPAELVDVNQNRVEACFDAFGVVVATAAKGKGNEGDDLAGFTTALANPARDAMTRFAGAAMLDEGQARTWLGNATSRFVYSFGERVGADGTVAWCTSPPTTVVIQREVHAAAAGGSVSPIQVAFECSDGGAGVLLKKVQAEPESPGGALRWIVTGKTVVNNKGRPVKQYEPYFSTRFGPEPVDEAGVTALMFYDAVGRLVRTELPDGTLNRAEFSPWQVRNFDSNDSVLESSWYQQRGAPSPGTALPPGADPETRAAWLAAQHANTPSVTVFDAHGREVVAIAHNRFADDTGAFRTEKYVTFTRLDTEGKPLWICDARGNLVMQYITPPQPDHTPLYDTVPRFEPSFEIPSSITPGYDIAANVLFQHSMDEGDRWTLPDAAGRPFLAWNHNQGDTAAIDQRMYLTTYDVLHRPAAIWQCVDAGPREQIERFEYQDAQAADAENLNGQLVRHYDAAGLLETRRRNFDGAVEIIERTLRRNPQTAGVDWQSLDNSDGSPKLEAETFTQITEHDALGRMSRLYNWHPGEGSRVAIVLPRYSERGLLAAEDLIVGTSRTSIGYDETAGTRTTVVRDVRYNAKGQKERLELGNGTVTRFDYDPQTLRLREQLTTRPQYNPPFPSDRGRLSDVRVLQHLHYGYDPVGNVCDVYDDAWTPAFFQNQQVEAANLYVYDALYRLVEGRGREHGALRGTPAVLEGMATPVQFPIGAPPDPNAVRNYTQTYKYDAAGNVERIHHEAGIGTWTRRFHTDAGSNRLLATWDTDDDWASVDPVDVTSYGYDAHGNMRNLARAPARFDLRWDTRDMIAGADLGGGGTAHYQYDAGKQRIRKRIDNQNGSNGYWERIDLGGYERYRRYAGDGVTLLEETESHHVFEGAQRALLVDDVLLASGPGAPRPDRLSVPQQTLYRYQYGNPLGSACLELDEQAAIISYEEYHPYGTSAYRALRSGVEAPPKRYRYAGMERDEETGLYYRGARFFLAPIARWCSADPAGIYDGTNRYRYARDNPIANVDLDGRQTVGTMRGLAAVARRDLQAKQQLLSSMAHHPEMYPSSTEATRAALRAEILALDKEASKWEARVDEHTDFHTNVGLPIVLNLAAAAVTAPIAAVAWPVRAAFAFMGGFGLGEAAQGKTVSLKPSTFGETKRLSGSDRAWHAVGSGSAVVGSVFGEVQIARSGTPQLVKDPFTKAPKTQPPPPPPPPAPVRRYSTKSMIEGYETEHLSDVPWADVVKHLTPEELAAYKLTIRDGKIYDANGNLFDTTAGKNDSAIFVMDEEGNIYARIEDGGETFKHSSFFGGKPVAAAGEVRVSNGVLEKWNDISGHYMPTPTESAQFIVQMEESGVSMAGKQTLESRRFKQ